MPVRVRPLLPLVALLLAGGASRGAAESPAVDTKRFPRLTHVFLLPEEQALLKELKDDKDRREFQKIFWARRDPTPGTPANEFEDNVRAVWKRADDIFSYSNQKGSETGCGQVLALLGRPEETLDKGDALRTTEVHVSGKTATERGTDAQKLGPGSGKPFDNTAYIRDGAEREPETWVYRDRPGLPYTFTGAEARIAFDSECKFAEGGILAQDLRRAAAAFVTRPDITYSRGSDGHLAPLASAAAASSGASAGAQALLAAPRNDFPLAAESKLLMRGPKGEAYVAGLVRAAAGATGPPARLSLAAQASDAAGQAVASSAREMTARPEADGSLVASWGLSLKPGRYKVTVAALLAEPSKGSVSTIDVEVPDFGGGALVASPLVVYPDEPPAGGAANARDPYAAMQLGPMRLHPRIGNVFGPQDALMVVAALYGAKADPASGQAGLRSRFSILKDGKPVARGAEDVFTTPDAVASVGPIPLADYTPGAYVVRLDVMDAVAKQTLRQEAAFEIRKP
jgi:GWxTD domain-containing protein